MGRLSLSKSGLGMAGSLAGATLPPPWPEVQRKHGNWLKFCRRTEKSSGLLRSSGRHVVFHFPFLRLTSRHGRLEVEVPWPSAMVALLVKLLAEWILGSLWRKRKWRRTKRRSNDERWPKMTISRGGAS